MKRNIFILTLLALVLVGCNKDTGKSIVEGTLSGAEGKKVYLDIISMEAPGAICDSTVVNADGSFRLIGAIQNEPMFYNVRLENGKSFSVLLDSAETISLQTDARKELLVGNIQFNNSPRNENLQKVMTGGSQLLASIQAKEAPDSILMKIADFKEEVRQMIYADPRSMVGFYAMMQTVMGNRIFNVMDKEDHKVFSAVATSLQLAYPESKQVKFLCELVLAARAQQKLQAKRDSLLSTATTQNSPDIELPDADGNKIKLSSLRGKTVLLYFWVSTDEASRKFNQQLGRLYEKYQGKNFEIYAVSFDTSKVVWESASKTDYIKWINVCDLQGSNSPALNIYNVSSIPSNYILDPEGNLIGKDLFGSRLDEKMAELLK